MNKDYYLWGGEFTICSEKGNVAVVLLNTNYKPDKKVAIYGPLKTENIGIEKIVANTISNPNIRFLIVCGDEIRGHRSGKSLVALHKNGIDNNNKIINAPGAIPYIENLDTNAVKRFQKQINLIDLIGISDSNELDKKIEKYIMKKTSSYGKAYIAIRIEAEKIKIDDKRALHSKIMMNHLGKIKKRGK